MASHSKKSGEPVRSAGNDLSDARFNFLEKLAVKMLTFSRPVTAITKGEKIVIGFGFPGLAPSYNIRDISELRAMAKVNPAVMRNVTAHYLRCCGLSTLDIGKFLDISPSRVSTISAKGRLALYPAKLARDYSRQPSYLTSTAQAERKRWTSRITGLRAKWPRNNEELAAHLLQQATEEIVDAEDALSNFTGYDDRRMVAAAFELGRSYVSERKLQLAAHACICTQCEMLRARDEARLAEADCNDDS